MERSVQDKTVVVTGGATGIGLEIAKKFLEEDAKVAILLDINEQMGIDAAKDLVEKYGQGKAVFIKCDVTSDLEATYKKLTYEYKTIDVLINNAGAVNENSIRQTIELNTIAVMEWTSKFYDSMRKDRGGNGGTIINLSSIFGFRTTPHGPYYQASKFAVMGFSKSIGHDYNYNKTGVRVLVCCPGFTYTNLISKPERNTFQNNETLQVILEEYKKYEFQEVEAVGSGIIEIFKRGDSGTAWLVEGSRPAVML